MKNVIGQHQDKKDIKSRKRTFFNEIFILYKHIKQSNLNTEYLYMGLVHNFCIAQHECEFNPCRFLFPNMDVHPKKKKYKVEQREGGLRALKAP